MLPSYSDCEKIVRGNSAFCKKEDVIFGVPVSQYSYRNASYSDFNKPLASSSVSALELRGISFVADNEKNLHSRKRFLMLHKFFNINQTEGYMLRDLCKNRIVSAQEKVDGCLDFDTEIETLEYGILPIGKIIEEKIYCYVKSFDFDLCEIVYKPIIAHSVNENNVEWFLIELENGKKIKVTENHYIWLPKLNCFRKVKDLKNDDEIMYDE